MAKAYLTPDELVLSQAWLKTVFFPALKGNCDYLISGYYDDLTNCCKRIYDFIVKKLWIDIDGDIETLSKMKYKVVDERTPENGKDYYSGPWYKVAKSKLCGFFANMCKVSKIWWEDDEHTKEELNYFLTTEMGKTLWNFGCFISQDDSIGKSNIKITDPNATTSTKQPRSSSSGSTTSSGKKLNKANGGAALVSPDKEVFNQNDVYWIGGTFTNGGKTNPRIHVSPMNQASPLKVKYTSGQGFDDCILYFKDYNHAEQFRDACVANMPQTVASLEIKRVKADPKGYYLVNTQFGVAYIKAPKLDEMLEELEENITETNSFPEVTTMEDVKEAYDALCKFLD